MSASREKKTRQDLAGSGWTDPKTVREAKQRKEAHRTNVLYGIIGVVFLLVAIAAIVWQTNIIPKSVTAATVNGEKYTAAEVNFYYENYYQNFLNNTYSYLSLIGHRLFPEGADHLLHRCQHAVRHGDHRRRRGADLVRFLRGPGAGAAVRRPGHE